MVFSSLTCLFLFLPLFFALYFIAPKPLRNTFLFLSGLVFYAWGEPFYVFILIFSTLIDYFAGLFIHKFDDRPAVRKIGLIVSVVMNVMLLGLFKYAGFIVTNINALLSLNIPDPKLHLPIGISFFTFQTMSYTIDVYRRRIKVQKNPINFGAFVTMFPQIVAGPIVRYEEIEKELNERRVSLDMVYDGIITFVTGLGKKVLLANGIGVLWDTVKTSDFSSLSAATAWLGILAFTFQIYFDFSGYSDMAIGLGKILGFNFPKNFNYPYTSRSISEFWRRWHMTLGNWFKSYVYFPLGGSRKGKGRTVFNLAVVWLLTGIWHGASWNFILWGSLYGLAIISEKLFLGGLLGKLPSLISMAYTMFLVTLGWVLFSLPDIKSAGSFIGVMFNVGGSGAVLDAQAAYHTANYGIIFAVCIFACTDSWVRLKGAIFKRLPFIVNYGAVPVTVALFVASVSNLVTAGYNPFLYFNF
ncbi:MAG: MBOAT family protein [Oscillospiraceae bacterium]|jgi:alginate O-acetyltransferase complex protein AlgI|nr:MBOAT family protein [Oscillospiraceae bacterium]